MKVYNDISVNWQDIYDKDEKKILKDYSEEGRFLTIFYACNTKIPHLKKCYTLKRSIITEMVHDKN